MTTISRECQCGAKALKDGSRCAKCGKPLPSKRRPRPPMLDPPPRQRVIAEPTGAEVDGYEALLDRLAEET